MLEIKSGKTKKTKGVLIGPIPKMKTEKAKTPCASTSLKDVYKKHDSIKKQNITMEKNT